MSALGPRAGGLRLIRLVLVAVCVGTSVNSVTSGLLFASNQTRASDIRDLALQTRHDAQVSTAALCALREDLERRVAASVAYLLEHPRGAPGIPARTIRDGIRNQKRTIAALSGIDC